MARGCGFLRRKDALVRTNRVGSRVPASASKLLAKFLRVPAGGEYVPRF